MEEKPPCGGVPRAAPTLVPYEEMLLKFGMVNEVWETGLLTVGRAKVGAGSASRGRCATNGASSQ